MLQNNETNTKRADHTASLMCFCVLILLLAATFIISRYVPETNAAMALISVSCAAFLIPSIVFLVLFKKSKGANVGMRRMQKGTLKFCVPALFLLLTTAVLFKSIVCYIFGYQAAQTVSILPGLGYFEAILCYAVLPAILEEIVFRGIAFSMYEKSFGGLGAIIITSFFFAMSHFSAADFVSYFISGVILATVVYICRSVFPAIILHFINNFISYYLENAVFKITSETKSGVLAIFILSAISLLLLFWFLLELEYICRNRYISESAKEQREQYEDGQADVCPRLLPEQTGVASVFARVFASPFVWAGALVFIVSCIYF